MEETLRRQGLGAVLLAIALLVLAPAAARADFGFDGSLQPDDLQAGGHPDVEISVTFTGSENPDRMVVRFPPGLLGNPQATPRCPLATFRTANCPGNTAVGSVGGSATVLGLPAPVSGSVFNLEPEPGEPARLGVFVSPLGIGLLPVRNEAAISLRPDGGLDSTITGIAGGLPLGAKLNSLTLTLFGTAGSEPFMTNPTSCQAATTILEAAPAGGATVQRSSTFTPEGCDAVPFDPGASIALEHTRRAAPSGYTMSLSLPADEEPIRQSHVRRAEVLLPQGTTLSPGVAAGLEACTDAQYTQGSCPEASRIGSVQFATPLIGTLGGAVSFGEPRSGNQRLIVEVDQSGVHLNLVGTVTLDPATGQITTVFDELPQVPFTSFALTFKGGDHAVLANPSACGTYAVAARLTPWSGGPVKTAQSSFTINDACGAPFNPGLGISLSSTAAGRPAGAVTIDITRPDGDQELRRVTTELPPGLAGSIAGVELCPEDRANAGTCSEASRLGRVNALVGPGGAPVPLEGRVYLTGPVEGGLVGMAIVLPGKVGPVDLGTVVTRAGISLRPADGGLTVRTGELPRMVGGVPVSIRRLALTLDRPGFMVNASSCAPQTMRAVLEGAGGATAAPTARYQATDCAGLPFEPKLRARLGTRRKPALKTVITIPRGHAATSRAVVTLPPNVGVDIDKLADLCTLAQQAAGPCPEQSRIGRGVARSPLLPVPLSGPVYLAALPSQALPGLRIALGGPVSLTLNGTIAIDASGSHTTFAGIPDVPLERFELTFDGGREGALKLARNICRGKVERILGELTGHNGKTVRLRRPFSLTGCKPTAKLTLRGSPPRLRLRVNAPRGGAPLRRVKLTLPRGLHAHPRAGSLTARAGGKRARAKLSRRGVLTVSTKRVRKVTVTLGGGAITGSARKGFRVETRGADGRRARLKLRAK
jgi:hypothetical protein